jgi:aminopeptidase N
MVKPQTNNIVKYNGSNKYKALLLNYEDHTFVKVVIDTYSLNFFSSGNLTKIKDTLTRTMIWRSFFDMVKDGKISSLRYIDVFEQNISN